MLFRSLLAFSFLFISFISIAQIPDGSTAPDFTLTDFDGVTHNLYDVLDDNKSVIIDFSATWCGICWNYHQSHAIEDTYTNLGPTGTNEMQAFFIETDANTNDACVLGQSDCSTSSIGNWTNGTSYPVFNLTGADLSVKSDFGITGTPTIIAIAPNKKLYETGTKNSSILTSWVTETLSLSASAINTSDGIDLTVENGFGSISFAWSNGETTEDLIGVDAGTYSVTVTEGRGHSVELMDLVVEASAISISCPPTLETTCNAADLAPYVSLEEYINAGGQVTGNVNDISFTLIDESDNGNTCPQMLTRIYGVADLDGNVSSCSQSIIIDDLIAPNMISAPDVTISADDIANSLFQSYDSYIAAGGSISDNCTVDENSFSILSEVSDGEIYCEQITRIYTVADLCGNTTTTSHHISVLLSPDAQLSFEEDTNNTTVDFTSSTDFATSYLWDFADGNTSTEENPSHTYTDYGAYTVCLTGTTDCGSKTVCQNVLVIGSNASIVCPPAISSVCSIDETPPILNLLEWQEQGGGYAGDVNEASFSLMEETSDGGSCPEIVTRTYIIEDVNGDILSCSRTITINDQLAPTMTSPTDLSIDENDIASTQYIDYQQYIDAGGTANDNCGIDELSFSFLSEISDGETYCEKLSRFYAVSDNCGNTATIEQQVFINLLSTSQLSFTETSIGLDAEFTSSTDFAMDYFWDFGDGATSTEVNPSHTFPSDGVYNVCLTGSISCGERTVCEEVTIMLVNTNQYEKNAKLVSVHPVPAHSQIQLNIESTVNIEAIEIIDIAGRTTSTLTNITHQQTVDISMLNAGLYLVRIHDGNTIIYKKFMVSK